MFANDVRDKLASSHRSEREGLGTYTADLRQYACQGYPTFDNSQQEELALQASDRLQEHNRLSAPSSLSTSSKHRTRQADLEESRGDRRESSTPSVGVPRKQQGSLRSVTDVENPDMSHAAV